MRDRQKADEVNVFLWSYYFGLRMRRQADAKHVAHVWIGVKWQYYRYIRPFKNPNQSVGNSTHAFAKILSTMRGDKNNAAVLLSRQYVASVRRQLGICVDKGLCSEKSVDDRIAGHIDAIGSGCSLAAESPRRAAVGAKCWSAIAVTIFLFTSSGQGE